MMIGVAQVIGMKPTVSFFFSMFLAASWAMALAASRGKTEPTSAAAPAPKLRRKARRASSLPSKIAFITERSTTSSRSCSEVEAVTSVAEHSGPQWCLVECEHWLDCHTEPPWGCNHSPEAGGLLRGEGQTTRRAEIETEMAEP